MWKEKELLRSKINSSKRMCKEVWDEQIDLRIKKQKLDGYLF
jgi:hypothetical protein